MKDEDYREQFFVPPKREQASSAKTPCLEAFAGWVEDRRKRRMASVTHEEIFNAGWNSAIFHLCDDTAKWREGLAVAIAELERVTDTKDGQPSVSHNLVLKLRALV